MFKNANTSREQGDIGLTAALFYLSKEGHVPLIPVTDNNPFDLVVYMNGMFKSVQVKTTTVKSHSGNFKVELRRIRPNNTRNVIHKFDSSSVDYVFVLTEESNCYLIPSEDIKVKSQLTITSAHEKYKL